MGNLLRLTLIAVILQSNESHLIKMVLVLLTMGFRVSQLVKNLPAMWEIQVRSLGQEDSLGKEKVTHSRILAWRIP